MVTIAWQVARWQSSAISTVPEQAAGWCSCKEPRHLRIRALQPEPSAAGPARDANAAQSFPPTVGSGYYYTKQNKLRSLILVYLWIQL